MKMNLKAVAIILAFFMFFVSFGTMVILPITDYKNALAFEQSKENKSEIADLFSQRNQALVEDNQEVYEKCTEQLRACGVEELSIEEIMEFVNTAEVFNEDLSVNPQSTQEEGYYSDHSIITEAENNVFESYSEDFRYKNEYYTYKNIIVTPKNTSSKLYSSGQVTLYKQNSGLSVALGVASTLLTEGLNEVSQIIEIACTLGEIVSDITSAFSNLSEKDNIEISYTWSAAETCSFTYLYMTTGVDAYKYRQIMNANSVSTAINIAIPGMVYTSAGEAVAYVYTANKTGKYVSQYFADGYSSSIAAINNDYVWTITQIPSFTIYGPNDATIKKVSLRNPNTPTDVGYVW